MFHSASSPTDPYFGTVAYVPNDKRVPPLISHWCNTNNVFEIRKADTAMLLTCLAYSPRVVFEPRRRISP
jgi:hypothetical protein